MRRLMLLRHAKSDVGSGGISDHERPLNARGRTAAAKIGSYLAHNGLIPDRIFCSTAKRTRETVGLLAGTFPKSPSIDFDEALYMAEAANILDLVRAADAAIHCLLVVGHNPGLQQAALRLIASGDVDLRERLNEKLPTAALVVIDVPLDDWRKLHQHAGRLDRFITPALLDAGTD